MAFDKYNMYAISPLDGRYSDKVGHLSTYFSEYALMSSRCRVELSYVIALNETKLFPKLYANEIDKMITIMESFSEEDYIQIKEIEKITKHDVKSCEVFLRQKINSKQVNNLIHFGLTSEDVNNLAYSLLFRDFMIKEHIPILEKLLRILINFAEMWKKIPFPTKTHGQKASPSTAGKEIAVYINRLIRQYCKLKSFCFLGKLNGAIGNFSALLSAFPNYNWDDFSNKFIKELGFIPNIATTQIEDHDTWAEYFNITRQINNIIIDMDTDFWLYISSDLFNEQTKEGEVGSSTMPHKVNPINFENSEGNLMLSNAILSMLSDKLCRSRMQRDLSDSTVTRNIGTALSYSYLAIIETINGLQKLRINEDKCISELENSPELLAEPIQTILRAEGIEDPYTILKQFTRGKKITKENLLNFIQDIPNISNNARLRIESLKPTLYIGDAIRICDNVLNLAKKELEK